MASLQFDEQSSRWRIRFYFRNREYKRSLKTKSERQARGILQRVEDTILFLEHGRLEILAGRRSGAVYLDGWPLFPKSGWNGGDDFG